jgi:hypothetical protein
MEYVVIGAFLVLIILTEIIRIGMSYPYWKELDELGESGREKCVHYFKSCIATAIIAFVAMLIWGVIAFALGILQASMLSVAAAALLVMDIFVNVEEMNEIKNEDKYDIYVTEMHTNSVEIRPTLSLCANFSVYGKSTNYDEDTIKIYGYKTAYKIKEMVHGATGTLIIRYYGDSHRIYDIQIR